jgi:hypothetical protein
MSCPLIVELRANESAAAFRNPIGTTRPGFDQPPLPQPVEDSQVEVSKDHPVARDACYGRDFGTVATFVQDAATKGQNVQRTLLIS